MTYGAGASVVEAGNINNDKNLLQETYLAVANWLRQKLYNTARVTRSNTVK